MFATNEPSVRPPAVKDKRQNARRFLWFAALLILLHATLMLVRYGELPPAPSLGDEVIINDAAISLGTGHGYAATSFAGSFYGLDRLFAHFPPLYPLAESLAIRLFGVSVYSLRLTTTVMSIGASAVFLLLLLRLCRVGLLGWDTACLVGAIYSTFTPIAILERTARMESMIEFLALLSLAAIFAAATTTRNSGARRRWLLTAGALAGLCAAVHPEALTVMLLLGVLAVFAVPNELPAKVASVLVALGMPIAVWVLTFGVRSGIALRQLRAILRYETPTEPGIWQWARIAARETNVSILNQNLSILAVLVLLLLLPAAYLFAARGLPASSLRRRVSLCYAGVAVAELGIMEWGLHADCRRYIFLFGPLLIGLAVAAVGSRPLQRWQWTLGSLLLIAQFSAAMLYFHPGGKRGAVIEPDRFMPIVKSVPAGVSIAASPALWLDLREEGRPFALLYHGKGGGFDGEKKWAKESANPLDRFAVVILDESDEPAADALQKEAAAGRVKRTYRIGGEIVDVYQVSQPAHVPE